MLPLSDFQEAHLKLKEVLQPTNLIFSDVFSKESQNQVYIKPENMQRTGSFKVRGAYNKIAKLTEEEKARGVIAASAGNHAQGVALSASMQGIKATIVMPKHTPLIKVNATKQYGAEVVLYGDIYDEAYQKARELQEEHGYVFVHPFDDKEVIEGQGTIALEILEELPDADVLLVPIGGGGLVAGVAAAAKAIKPSIKVIGVEPEGAACALLGMKSGYPVNLRAVSTIAEGAAVRRVGDLALQYMREYVDEIITVSDYDLVEAFLLFVERHKMVAEGAGLLSLAALKKIHERGKNIVSVVSGGNIDVTTIASLINKGLIIRGRIFTFTVNLLDRPGELFLISQIIAEAGANVIQLDHNQFKNLARFMDVELHVTVETNGKEHIKKLTEEFASKGYQIVPMDSEKVF